MAVKLPSVLDYASRQAPRPDTGVVSYRPTSGAEGAEGEALANLGRAATATGDDLFKRYEVEKQKQDTLRAEEALTSLREQQIELTYGEKNGFVLKKGTDAVNGDLFKNYSAQIRDKIAGIESQLATPEQKELFRRRANMVGVQFQEALLRHITGERKVYDKQVVDGVIAVETRLASQQWNNPNEIGASILRVRDRVTANANEQGWGKEAREASLLAAEGKIHNAVLGQMLATENYVEAKKYFDENRAAIDPAMAKAVEKGVEDGVQKQVSGQYRLAYVNTRNDPRGLALLENAVTKDNRLDDTRRAALLGPIMSQRANLERRAEAAYERGLRRISSTISGINETTLAGFTPDQDTLLKTYNAAKGTELEADALQAIRLVEVTSKLKSLPPAQRTAEIDKIEAAVRVAPMGGAKGRYDWKTVNQLRTLDQNMTREARNNPYGFAVAQGLTPPQPVDWSDPGKSADALSQRFLLAGQMQGEYGTPYKPLAPEEARQIKDILKTMPVDKKTAWLGNLATATGASAQGRRGYIGIMGQLAEDDPVTASAGYQAARKRYSVSEQILNGQAILEPPAKEDGKPAGGSLITMPPDNQLRQQFDRTAPVEAYGRNVKARSIDFQAARAIYADLLSKSKTKDTGTLDSDMWDRAIELAAGRITRINGRQTILPPDMDKAEFNAGLRARLNAAVAEKRLPEGMTTYRIEDLPVEPVGVGIYAVRSGDGYLVDKTGKRFEVNFNLPLSGEQEPVRARRGTLRPGQVRAIQNMEPDYGERQDGSKKGAGYLGELKRPDGSVSTEISIGVNIDGKETEIPTLVPGLSKGQIDHLLAGKEPTKEIVDKAVAHARKRIKDGKSPFAD